MARLLKIYDGTAWVELAKKSDIPSLSGYATQTWVGNNYLPLSGGTLTGSLQIYSTGSSWNEGVRLHAASNGWSGVVFCDTTNTGDTGSSANTWSIHNYEGVFGAFKNGSNISSVSVGFAHDGSNWQFKGGDIYVNSSGRLAYYSEIPSSLPANGGNADTVDSEHAVAFAHRGVGNNLITAGNEFNFIPSGYGGSSGSSVWINYTTDSRDNTGLITEYILGKGNTEALGTIIHSGNIGSQSVNYATTAGSAPASDVYAWAKASTKPSYSYSEISGTPSSLPANGGTANAIAITGYGAYNFTYYQTDGSFQGNSGWSSYLVANHGDGSTYYNQIIALPFWSAPKYCRKEGGTDTSWFDFVTDENLSTKVASASVNYANSAGGVAWSNVSSRPTDLNDFTNNAGYIKGINSTMVINALGYTPANSSSLSNYVAYDGNGNIDAGTSHYVSGSEFYAYDGNYHTEYKKNCIVVGYQSSTFTLNYPSLSWNTTNTLATQEWVSSQNYLTGITSTQVTNALGYTPYNGATNPNNYTSNTGTVTSVSAGTGLSISGTASTTPTVNIASGYKLPQTSEWNGKQDALVSGSNIKTINGESILGAGNISISAGGWSTALYQHNIVMSFGSGRGQGRVSFSLITYDSYTYEDDDADLIAYKLSLAGYYGDVCLPASGFLKLGDNLTVYGVCMGDSDTFSVKVVDQSNGASDYVDDDYNYGIQIVCDTVVRIN